MKKLPRNCCVALFVWRVIFVGFIGDFFYVWVGFLSVHVGFF